MKTGNMLRYCVLCLLAFTATAASAQEEEKSKERKPSYRVLGEFVSPEDSLPRLKYFADGLVTPNDRCPVRKVKLNAKMAAAYVNGLPIGFC